MIIFHSSVGKTSLLFSYAKDSILTSEIPPVSTPMRCSVKFDEISLKLDIWDSFSAESYSNIRILSYPDTDIFICCFSIVNTNSFDNIKRKWFPEISQHSPHTPVLLCGLKSDMRENIEQLNLQKISPITHEQGLKLAQEINAINYVEISSLRMVGVKEAFECAARAVQKVTLTPKTSQIFVVGTGGTLDKDYPKTLGGYAFEISEPAVSRILSKVAPQFQYRIESVLKKDSLDITVEDRALIVETCVSAPEDMILITHGTSTMLQTAEQLALEPKLTSKTIVLTGAFKPERFIDSDAAFNVGLAIGGLHVFHSQRKNLTEKKIGGDVYIAMNGMIFPYDACEQNSVGFYVAKNPSQ